MKVSKSHIMTAAWIIAKEKADFLGGKARQYIGFAMKQAWEEARRVAVDSYETAFYNCKKAGVNLSCWVDGASDDCNDGYYTGYWVNNKFFNCLFDAYLYLLKQKGFLK